jgi:hypothetical protein
MSKSGTEEKSRLLSLPSKLIDKILKFLELNDLIRNAMVVNKELKRHCSCSSVLPSCVFSSLGIAPQYGLEYLKQLSPAECLEMVEGFLHLETNTIRIPFVSYYTDGGVKDKDSGLFIQNIFKENPTHPYVSNKGKNVNVKAICCEQLEDKIDLNDLNQYSTHSNNDQLYQLDLQSILRKTQPQFQNQFSLIQYFDIHRNLYGYIYHNIFFNILLDSRISFKIFVFLCPWRKSILMILLLNSLMIKTQLKI